MGLTLGTPIAMLVRNKDQRPGDSSDMAVAFRPSMPDAHRTRRSTGNPGPQRRRTVLSARNDRRVAAGADRQANCSPTPLASEVIAWVKRIHTIEAAIDPTLVTLEAVEATMVALP